MAQDRLSYYGREAPPKMPGALLLSGSGGVLEPGGVAEIPAASPSEAPRMGEALLREGVTTAVVMASATGQEGFGPTLDFVNSLADFGVRTLLLGSAKHRSSEEIAHFAAEFEAAVLGQSRTLLRLALLQTHEIPAPALSSVASTLGVRVLMEPLSDLRLSVGLCFGRRISCFEVGATGDLVLRTPAGPSMLVIVAGRLLLRGGELLTSDSPRRR